MPLRPEVIKFYKDNGYKVSDFFDSKRHGGIKLSKAQIKAGVTEYYEKIRKGEISPYPRKRLIGWGPIEHAKIARFEEFKEDERLLREYKPIVNNLEKTIKIWRMVFWFLLLGSCMGVGFLADLRGFLI